MNKDNFYYVFCLGFSLINVMMWFIVSSKVGDYSLAEAITVYTLIIYVWTYYRGKHD